MSLLRLLNDLVVILAGAIWGILASAFYDQVIYVYLRFPYDIFVALTLLLPGVVGKVVASNIFGFPPPRFQVWDVVSTTVAMFAGMAILYFLWWLRKEIIFPRTS